MQVSVLTPTRGRPALLQQMVASCDAQHVIWQDDDDARHFDFPGLFKRGPRQPLGRCWNRLAKVATGEYLMMGNDDLVFRSENWKDRLFEEVKPDELKVAFFDDGINGGKHAAFPIVTRAWYERMGHFTAELFSFGYHDTWIFDIAMRANALVYIGDVLVEHLHPTVGKREADRTFMERNWTGDSERFQQTEWVRHEMAKWVMR